MVSYIGNILAATLQTSHESFFPWISPPPAPSTTSLYFSVFAISHLFSTIFSFVSILESLGHYITTINGLEQDEEKDYYWTIRIETLEHWAQEGMHDVTGYATYAAKLHLRVITDTGRGENG